MQYMQIGKCFRWQTQKSGLASDMRHGEKRPGAGTTITIKETA